MILFFIVTYSLMTDSSLCKLFYLPAIILKLSNLQTLTNAFEKS